MIKKILKLPVKAVKGTAKVASWAYKGASAALMGAAVYKGVQKVIEKGKDPMLMEMPPIPDSKEQMKASKSKPKKTAKKKSSKKKPAKKKPAKKKSSSKKKK